MEEGVNIMTRAERRKKDYAKAIRKKKLAEELYSNVALGKDYKFAWYNNLHQYSKNKIHCSCHLCSSKTKNKGKRRKLHGNYAPSYNPCIHDIKRNESMDYDEKLLYIPY